MKRCMRKVVADSGLFEASGKCALNLPISPTVRVFYIILLFFYVCEGGSPDWGIGNFGN